MDGFYMVYGARTIYKQTFLRWTSFKNSKKELQWGGGGVITKGHGSSILYGYGSSKHM